MVSDEETNEVGAFRLSLVCPARLHFGLMEICPGEPNLYGGLGVAVSEPPTRVTLLGNLLRSGSIRTIMVDCEPSLNHRIERVIRRSSELEIAFNNSPSPSARGSSQSSQLRLSIEGHADQHSGMGSGTQLACAVATVLRASQLLEQKQSVDSVLDVWTQTLGAFPEESESRPLDRLAAKSGRGLRSYIGLASHLEGGLIVDHGMDANQVSPRQVEHFIAPVDWPVILITSDSDEVITGEQEVSYFSRCETPNPKREMMRAIVTDQILPALQKQEFLRFAESLRDYGRYGGEIFLPIQGGIYRNARIAELIERLHRMGLVAIGQSSWGPTIFAIVADLDQANLVVAKLRAELPNQTAIRLTRMTNSPARWD